MNAPSNANTSGLAPCPFCGGEAWLNDYEAKYSDLPPMSRAPQCRSCGASLGYLTTPAKATEAWNRRVTATSAQARIDAAEARADRLAKALKETRNRVREWPIDDHETCMCGSPVASHGMGDGHSPVSQGDHAISMIVEAINEALQQETQK